MEQTNLEQMAQDLSKFDPLQLATALLAKTVNCVIIYEEGTSSHCLAKGDRRTMVYSMEKLKAEIFSEAIKENTQKL